MDLTTDNLRENPFNTNLRPIEGFFHSNRTSDLALYYHQDGLPTPWPILAASMGLSSFMALLGFLGESMTYRKFRKTGETAPQSLLKTLISMFGVTVATIRTVALIPVAVKAIRYHGKVPAPSSILGFLMSISPYMASPRKLMFLRYIACIDMVIVFALMCALTGATRSSHFDYGSLYLAGGNCPTYVTGRCNDTSVNNWGTIGCGKLFTFNDTLVSTPVHSLETAMATLQYSFGSIIAGYALFMVFFGICVARYDREDARGVDPQEFHKPGREAQKAELRKCFTPEATNTFAFLLAGAAFLFVVGLTAAILPIHIKAVRNPNPVSVVDAIGKEYYIYDNGNYLFNYQHQPGSWSECFEITPSTSPTGFLSTWWKSENDLVARLIAVV